jgi:hypothetical protein
MFFKVVFGTSGLVIGSWTLMALASTTFHNKLDRNVLKPIRNYNANLNDIYKM